MSRWNLPPWVSLALAVAGPVAAATWWVQGKQVEQTEQVRELRAATMARLDALYYEVCAIRQSVDAKSISKVCGSDGRPDLQPVVSRYFAGVPEPDATPYIIAYVGIGACAVGAACLLLFAGRSGQAMAKLDRRIASLERWREAECPRRLLPKTYPNDEDMGV